MFKGKLLDTVGNYANTRLVNYGRVQDLYGIEIIGSPVPVVYSIEAGKPPIDRDIEEINCGNLYHSGNFLLDQFLLKMVSKARQNLGNTKDELFGFPSDYYIIRKGEIGYFIQAFQFFRENKNKKFSVTEISGKMIPYVRLNERRRLGFFGTSSNINGNEKLVRVGVFPVPYEFKAHYANPRDVFKFERENESIPDQHTIHNNFKNLIEQKDIELENELGITSTGALLSPIKTELKFDGTGYILLAASYLASTE